MINQKVNFLTSALMLLVLMMQTSCKKEFGNTNVRFVHASPDAPALGVVNAGNSVVNSLVFDAISEYVTVDRANLFFSFRNNDEQVGSLSNPQFGQDAFYGVYLTDTLGRLGHVTVSNAHETPTTGKALVRFLQLSPDLPSIKLVANGTILFNDKTFVFAKSGSIEGVSPFVELDAGSYDFIGRNENNTVLTDISLVNSVLLEAGKTYTIYAKGFFAKNSGQPLGLGVVLEM